MKKGQRWFYGFTPPFKGVKPINQTRVGKPKTRVLEGKPTVGLEDLCHPRRLTRKEANYYGNRFE